MLLVSLKNSASFSNMIISDHIAKTEACHCNSVDSDFAMKMASLQTEIEIMSHFIWDAFVQVAFCPVSNIEPKPENQSVFISGCTAKAH